MLKLYEHDAFEKNSAMTAVLSDAVNVRITKEINTADNLSFTLPAASPKAALIKANMLVVCGSQRYRIMRVIRSNGTVDAECMHIWFADSSAAHMPTVYENIGIPPYDLIRAYAAQTGFMPMSEEETERLGMRWIGKGDMMKPASGGKEFAIDFFAVDKISLFDFVSAVIANSGLGEMYYDNTDFAVVEKIGSDNGLRLELSSNMSDISVETDISSLVTRLYPYGYEDLTIGSAAGANYIDSPNIGLYGLKEGYKDYSDYINADDLYNNALWEFDENNPDRIDAPALSISGSVSELDRFASGTFNGTNLGDSVTVVDETGAEIKERITAITYYPYENIPSELTIGRVKRDLYFYVSQISELSKKYSRCATASGLICARSIQSRRPAPEVYAASGIAVPADMKKASPQS